MRTGLSSHVLGTERARREEGKEPGGRKERSQEEGRKGARRKEGKKPGGRKESSQEE